MTAQTRLKTLCPALAALCVASLVSGCATVDLASMGGATTVDTVEAQPETNVVQRSVETLRAAFVSRGLGEKSSKRKMQAAADLLLNGLSAKTASVDASEAYIDRPVATILDDLNIARGHVEQTTRAAEIYLALAKADRTLDEELASLQSALLVSERAGRLFDQALSDSHATDLAVYKTSLDRLRTVTDGFGDRVRMQRSDKLAISAAAAS